MKSDEGFLVLPYVDLDGDGYGNGNYPFGKFMNYLQGTQTNGDGIVWIAMQKYTRQVEEICVMGR